MQDVTAGDVLSTQPQRSPEALALPRPPQGSLSELDSQHPWAQVRVTCWVGLTHFPAFPQATRSRDTKDTEWGHEAEAEGTNVAATCRKSSRVLSLKFGFLRLSGRLSLPRPPHAGLAPKWALRLRRPGPPRAPAEATLLVKRPPPLETNAQESSVAALCPVPKAAPETHGSPVHPSPGHKV